MTAAATELITVAICSIGEAEESLEACIVALEGAGVTHPLVLKAGDGVASLRNQALVECETPVIAYVDDDVIVERDWLEVLVSAWTAAPSSLACIGGATIPRRHPSSPGWLTDALAAATTTNTLPSPDENQAPSEKAETYCAGNVSFRTAALRGIGGFWPATGAGRLRDWFTEEHHAQRELARVGWATKLEPGITASRQVGEAATLASVVAAQARAGARGKLIGGRHDRETVAALRAAAGSAAAAAKLNGNLAVERLVRAAGHAGTLAPQLIGASSIAPATSYTQFRHSIPTPNAATVRGSQSNIACYHRVTDEDPPSGLAISTDEFRRQLLDLLRHGDPTTVERIAHGKATKGSFAITFDDGYADNLHVALPILDELGIPATFYVTTGKILSGEPFWWDQVARLLEQAGRMEPGRRVLELRCGESTRSWAPSTAAELTETQRLLTCWFQSQLPEEIDETIKQLEDFTGSVAKTEPDRPMTPDELRELARHPLATIGSHTRTHANLRFCPDGRLQDELLGSRSDLGDLLGEAPLDLAYPFGVWGADVDDETVSAARECGFRSAVLNSASPRTRGPLALGRTAR